MTGIFFFLAIYFSESLSLFFEMPALEDIIQVLSFIFILRGVLSVPLSLLTRDLNFKGLAIINSFSYILGYGLIGIILAYNSMGVWSLVFANICEVFFKCIGVLIIKYKTISFGFHMRSFRELISFGAGQSIYQINNFASREADKLIIGKFLGPDALGIYGRAYQLLGFPVKIFVQSIGRVLFPAFSKIQNDIQKLSKIFIEGVSSIAFGAFPLSLFLYFFSPELVYIFLGPQWIDTIILIKVFSIIIFFRLTFSIKNSILKSSGNVYFLAYLQGLLGLTILFSSWFATTIGGVYEVTIAIALCLLINYLFLTNKVIKVLKISWSKYLKSIILQTPYFFIYFITLWIISTYLRPIIDNHYFTILIASVVLASLVFVVFLIKGEKFFGRNYKTLLNALNIMNLKIN